MTSSLFIAAFFHLGNLGKRSPTYVAVQVVMAAVMGVFYGLQAQISLAQPVILHLINNIIADAAFDDDPPRSLVTIWGLLFYLGLTSWVWSSSRSP